MALHRPQPIVSVIIPALDEQEHIGDQLEALSRCVFEPWWEVIIADNGSKDDTVRIARSWQSQFPDLQVIDASARRGCGAAKNLGAAAASGEILAFCDADDIVEPGWLAALYDACSQADIVGGSSRIFVAADGPGYGRDDGFQQRLQTLLGFLPFADGCNFAIRRTVFERLGGFDETITYAENVDLSWRGQLAGNTLGFATNARVHKRERADTGALVKQFYRYGKSDVLLYERFRQDGIDRQTLRTAIRAWAALTLRMPFAAMGRRRRSWIVTAAKHAGRLVGSFQRRQVCL